MFSLDPRPRFLQFAHYPYFAEPFLPGVMVAYEDVHQPDDELADAAEALRAAEVEAVQDDTHGDIEDANYFNPPIDPLTSMRLTDKDLESMSIDEVREVARVLDIPERSKITEKAVLIEEILRRI